MSEFSLNQINFPSPKVKEKDKDESWHKQYVQAIAAQALNETYVASQQTMDLNYRYYNGDTLSEEYKFLEEDEDGETLPARWMSMNRIKNRVDVLLGEFTKKSYSIRVEAINEEAKSKRLQYRKQLEVDMVMQPIAMEMEQATGIPLQPPYPVPQDEDELEAMTKNYKEISEYVMETALKFIAKKNNWDYERRAFARDVYITGRAVIKTDIHNGIPRSRRVDPRLFVFDPHATDDHLTDASYFGEVEYMRVAEAANKYNLSEKEILDAYKDTNHAFRGRNSSEDSNFFGLVDNSPISFFQGSGSSLRVLVLRAVWRDVKQLKYKESVDRHGGLHIKQLRPSDRDKDAKTRNIEIWRQGTLIAGKFMKDWGELDNRPTDIGSLSETLPPYVVIAPNYINYRTVSIVDQLRPLQDLKNIVWYNIQKEMAAAGGKAFVYDVSQLPTGWEAADVIKYLRSARIAFINSRVNGQQSAFNQFSQIDQSMSDAVRQYLDINMRIDAEMDAISGINEARQGMVSSPSQAVGVTHASIVQSAMGKESIEKCIQEAMSRVLNLQAKLVKLTWDKPDTYSPIIGDVGVNFIEQDIELDLNDYAVFAEETPPAFDDMQTYNNVVITALQSGGLDFVDALIALQEKDPREAILRLSKLRREREQAQAEAQQQEMAMRQMEAQAAMQAAQMSNEAKIGVQQVANQGKVQSSQIAAQAAIDSSLAKARATIGAKELDSVTKQAIERSKAQAKPKE